ncbi:hypothetical protein EOT10_28780 [Streptomyces antnestii]|uniref:Uncharacterized protein n=1 Tax=Streptomyces antnestii TaxID=2494256 RepID=A0A3S2VSP9_9ACTN|nr:hypothetical protein EOT10_28780 [Streptomyces sp. San01]
MSVESASFAGVSSKPLSSRSVVLDMGVPPSDVSWGSAARTVWWAASSTLGPGSRVGNDA